MCSPIFLVSKCIFVVFKCWDLSHALLIDNSVLSFFELNYVPLEWTVGDINKSCVTSSLASWYNVQIMINMVFNLAHCNIAQPARYFIICSHLVQVAYGCNGSAIRSQYLTTLLGSHL